MKVTSLKPTKERKFIPGNVPSLKNSKIKTKRGIFPSKTVMKYLRNNGIQKYSVSKKIVTGYKDKNRPNLFAKSGVQELFWGKTPPYQIGLHFVRKSKRKFDFNNASQIVFDLLTAHDYIEDDDMDNVIPCVWKINNKWYSHDKENPGVWIKVK